MDPVAHTLTGAALARAGLDRRTPLALPTLLIGANETREIAFVADNPGKWLFHCHMLEHAASGMTTWLEVT